MDALPNAVCVTRSAARCTHVWLLIWLVVALAGPSSQSMCTTRRFRTVEDHSLLGQTLATHEVLISAACLDLCTSHPKCVSYNYQYAGPAPHRCELNDATAKMCPGSVKPRTGFKYCEDRDASGKVDCFLEGSFRVLQNVSTTGAYTSEWFEINGHLFLAFANHYNGVTRELPSFVYDLQDTTFVLRHVIRTTGARPLKYFEINGDHFLAVGSTKDKGEFNLMSTIYSWDGGDVTSFQEIPTSGVKDVSFLQDGSSNKFLFVANYFDGTSHSINSTVYRWAGQQFVHYQDLPTHGASGCKAFMLNGETYVLFGNKMDDTKAYSTYSFLYKLSGNSRFVLFQSFLTNRAEGVAAFSVGDEQFLAINNFKNGNIVEVGCAIYKWNGSMFEHFQSIPTNAPRRVESGRTRGRTLLALTSSRADSPHSAIYLYIGTEFRKVQDIAMSYVFDLKFFKHGEDYYLAATKNRDEDGNFNVDSTIFKWQP